jgi:hypothetical protein
VASSDPRPEPTRRWDDDERGSGVADASEIAPRIEALAEHARRPAWVTEEGIGHLWPHLERAVGADGSPWHDAEVRVDDDGRLVVELVHVGATGDRPRARLRADAFALIGEIAEASTFVRVIDAEADATAGGASTAEVDVVTGLLGDETAFLTHGHTVRLRITAR